MLPLSRWPGTIAAELARLAACGAIFVRIRYLLPYWASLSSSSVSVRLVTLSGQFGNPHRVLCHWVLSVGICHCTYNHKNK